MIQFWRACAEFKKTLRAQFFWKHMARTIKAYVHACCVYQQAKYSTQAPAALLHPLSIPTHIWKGIAMDFIIDLPLSHGFLVIFVIVNRLSKFA